MAGLNGLKIKETLRFSAKDPDDVLFIDCDNLDFLPDFLYCDVGEKVKPQHFGLSSWGAKMTIPDAWMKKIYRKNIWRDTDIPEPEPEVINCEQKEILRQHLEAAYKTAREEKRVHSITRSAEVLPDDLIETLKECDSDIRRQCRYLNEEEKQARRDQRGPNGALVELNQDHIPLGPGHKIQPEEVIARQAIEKMRYLSVEEEARFHSLIKDEEFMSFLRQAVENYLRSREGPPFR